MFRLTNKLLLHQLLPLFFQVNSNQWKSVNEAEWKDGSIVALIQWIPQLTKTTMPSALRQRLVSRMLQEPLDVTSAALTQMDESQLEELVQWSDMVVFDYLTGNYDRVSSMQVSFDLWKIRIFKITSTLIFNFLFSGCSSKGGKTIHSKRDHS